MGREAFHSEPIVQSMAKPEETSKPMKLYLLPVRIFLQLLKAKGHFSYKYPRFDSGRHCLILRVFCLPCFLAALSPFSTVSPLIKTDVYQSTGNLCLND